MTITITDSHFMTRNVSVKGVIKNEVMQIWRFLRPLPPLCVMSLMNVPKTRPVARILFAVYFFLAFS